MKKFNLLLIVMFSYFAISCDDKEIITPETPSINAPTAAIEKAFLRDYKDAKNLKWEKHEDDYHIARFEMGGVVKSNSATTSTAVWYDADGNDYLVEDYISVEDIPQKYVDMFEVDCRDEYGNVRDIVSATRGCFKGSIFYKICCPGGEEPVTPYSSVFMYVGDESIGYWDELEEGEQIAKTILPKLYAIKFIETKYDDYVLLDSNFEKEENIYWVDIKIPNYDYTCIEFFDNKIENTTIDLETKFDNMNAELKAEIVEMLSGWGYVQGTYEFERYYNIVESNIGNQDKFETIETKFAIIQNGKYIDFNINELTGVTGTYQSISREEVNSEHEAKIVTKLNEQGYDNFTWNDSYVQADNSENRNEFKSISYTIFVEITEGETSNYMGFVYDVKSDTLKKMSDR